MIVIADTTPLNYLILIDLTHISSEPYEIEEAIRCELQLEAA
jgi:hypothetical protein